MALTSVRTNSVPTGGATAQQPVPPSNAPSDLEALKAALKPAIESFRQMSSPMTVVLPTTTLGQNTSDGGVRIASVGLGYRTITEWTGAITLSNTAAGAQTVNFSPYFPYNLIGNTSITINGGATVYSASGPAGLMVAARNRNNGLELYNTYSNLGPKLSEALCRVTVTGAGVTTTATTAGTASLSGIASISIPATTGVATVTVTFYTFEKLAFDRQSLIGVLPLQNNSTFALKVHSTSPWTGTNGTFPFFVAGAFPGTTTVAGNLTETTEYDFWSIPSDPNLYADLVGNSYQVQQQLNQTISATGPTALQYNVPQNQFLIAAHIIASDGNGAFLPFTALENRKLIYNAGSIIPVLQRAGLTRSSQYMDYGDDRAAFIPGYFLWDGENTTEDLCNTDQAGWIDAYLAAQPQIVTDVATGTVTPVNYSVTRESLVMGAVQVVGG